MKFRGCLAKAEYWGGAANHIIGSHTTFDGKMADLRIKIHLLLYSLGLKFLFKPVRSTKLHDFTLTLAARLT